MCICILLRRPYGVWSFWRSFSLCTLGVIEHCLHRTELIDLAAAWTVKKYMWTGEGMRWTRGGTEASGQRSSSTVSCRNLSWTASSIRTPVACFIPVPCKSTARSSCRKLIYFSSISDQEIMWSSIKKKSIPSTPNPQSQSHARRNPTILNFNQIYTKNANIYDALN